MKQVSKTIRARHKQPTRKRSALWTKLFMWYWLLGNHEALLPAEPRPLEGIWLAERDHETRPVERTGCPSSRPLPAKHMTYRGERKEVKSKQSIRNRLPWINPSNNSPYHNLLKRTTTWSKRHIRNVTTKHSQTNPSILSTAWEAGTPCTGAPQEATNNRKLQTWSGINKLKKVKVPR
jgi:hypothetical protein